MKQGIAPAFAALLLFAGDLHAAPAVPVHVAGADEDEVVDVTIAGDAAQVPVRAVFEALNGSDLTGIAELHTTPGRETFVHVVLRGLQPGARYALACGSATSACSTATDTIGTLTGPRGGVLSWSTTLRAGSATPARLTLWHSPVADEAPLACARVTREIESE